MLDRFVGDRELAKVVTDHFRLHLDLIEDLAIVYSNHTSNHFRHHNHVPQMSLHGRGFLSSWRLLLRLAQLLDQAHWLALQSTLETSAGPRMDDIHKLLAGQIQQLFELDAPEAEFAKGAPLPELLSAFGFVVRHGGGDVGVVGVGEACLGSSL